MAGWPAEVRDGLAVEVRRVADRLRTLSEAQLGAAAGPHPSRAAGARSLAQVLAVATQGLDERTAAGEPAWRQVPMLSGFAAGDQVAVTGEDLLAALEAVDPGETVWAPGARRTAAEVVADAAERLAALRRAL